MKLLLLSSKGGAGHTSTARALEAMLDDEIVSTYPIEEVGVGIEAVYNILLRNRWTRLVNFICRRGTNPVIRTLRPFFGYHIRKAIRREKPDIVISIAPLTLLAAAQEAERANLPYLIITTDTDLTNWKIGLNKLKHPNFKITVCDDLPTTTGYLKEVGIDPGRIEVTGLPIHPAFQTERTPAEQPTILISMGGAGGTEAYTIAKDLTSSLPEIRLIVLAGRNKSLLQKLRALPRVEAIPFTEDVAGLMKQAHLFITKPGPGTVAEAMAMRLPMLLDATDSGLVWERSNITLVTKAGVGEPFSSAQELKQLVSLYLSPERQKEIALTYETFPPNRFADKIGSLIQQMIFSSLSEISTS